MVREQLLAERERERGIFQRSTIVARNDTMEPV